MFYQSKDELIKLLSTLVSIPSVSGSEAEILFPDKVGDCLSQIPYFKQHPHYIQKHPTTDGRFFLTALYKKEHAKKTIVLISHFDVVTINDYGMLKDLAFSPEELTSMMINKKEEFSKDVQDDIEKGEWIFGRGTMDMKCGLALHISILEKAAEEKLDGNILLLTVPDEEANSVGMREAVPALLELAEKNELEFKLMLNSEPIFTQYPGDRNYYLYTGSIGKIMPGFLCLGQETHVGEPFSGLNANFMNSILTYELELNTNYCETAGNQISPPPTNLMQKDLKDEYSVQIPHRAISLFNLFLMNRSIEECHAMLIETAAIAARKIELAFEKRKEAYDHNNHTKKNIRVLSFAQLKNYAIKKYGKEKVIQEEENIIKRYKNEDDREISIRMVDEWAVLCKELAPMIVTFFAPPLYPAVNSHEYKLIQELIRELTEYSTDQFGINYKTVQYFNGISDLSYVSFKDSLKAIEQYEKNVPGWGKTYYIPFEAMKKIQIPVLNVGPLGKDAHKNTERLNLNHAFEQLPQLLDHLVKNIFSMEDR